MGARVEEGVEHAVLLPYPVQSHIIAMMELAHILIESGFRVTFINTEHNHERVATALAEKLKLGRSEGEETMQSHDHNHNMERIEFLTVRDGLERGDDRNDFLRLTEGITEVMRPDLEDLMAGSGAGFSCFVADVTMAWALPVAKKCGLRRAAAFWPASAGVLATILSIPELIQKGIIDHEGEAVKKGAVRLWEGMNPLDPTRLPWSCFGDSRTRKVVFEYFSSNNGAMGCADSVICNTFEDLEMPVLRQTPRIKAVGSLGSRLRSRGDPVCHFWPEDEGCAGWLNRQAEGSVIYVAFGSIAAFSNEQFQELALGLELTGRPFLWVVRPDFTATSASCFFPPGFQQRVEGRARMVGWSPQRKVLQHPAISCFISHCGWNSAMDGLRNGVPFLCWPFFADQFFNQSYITDVWRTGLRLAPDAPSGIVSRDQVSSKVGQLLKDSSIRERSLALKDMAITSAAKGGSSFLNLENFVHSLKPLQ